MHHIWLAQQYSRYSDSKFSYNVNCAQKTLAKLLRTCHVPCRSTPFDTTRCHSMLFNFSPALPGQHHPPHVHHLWTPPTQRWSPSLVKVMFTSTQLLPSPISKTSKFLKFNLFFADAFPFLLHSYCSFFIPSCFPFIPFLFFLCFNLLHCSVCFPPVSLLVTTL